MSVYCWPGLLVSLGPPIRTLAEPCEITASHLVGSLTLAAAKPLIPTVLGALGYFTGVAGLLGRRPRRRWAVDHQNSASLGLLAIPVREYANG